MPDQALRFVRSAWRVYNQTPKTSQDLFCENMTKSVTFLSDLSGRHLLVNFIACVLGGKVEVG
jgi:hypothetical protein